MNRLLIQSRQTRFYLNDTSVYRSVTPSDEIDISQIDWTWPIRIRNDLPEVVWLAAGDLKIITGWIRNRRRDRRRNEDSKYFNSINQYILIKFSTIEYQYTQHLLLWLITDYDKNPLRENLEYQKFSNSEFSQFKIGCPQP